MIAARRRISSRDHQRNDERGFDHSHGERQHQRAEGFAYSVRHYLGVMHRRQHAGHERGGE